MQTGKLHTHTHTHTYIHTHSHVCNRRHCYVRPVEPGIKKEHVRNDAAQEPPHVVFVTVTT